MRLNPGETGGSRVGTDLILESPGKSSCQGAGTRSARSQRGELDAHGKDDDAGKQVAPPGFTRVEHDDTNGIDTTFTLLTEEDALSRQNPFDEI